LHRASDRLSHPDVDKRQLSKVVNSLHSATPVNMLPAHESIIAALNTNCPVSELVKHSKNMDLSKNSEMATLNVVKGQIRNFREVILFYNCLCSLKGAIARTKVYYNQVITVNAY